jgi:hypothetical protein
MCNTRCGRDERLQQERQVHEPSQRTIDLPKVNEAHIGFFRQKKLASSPYGQSKRFCNFPATELELHLHFHSEYSTGKSGSQMREQPD